MSQGTTDQLILGPVSKRLIVGDEGLRYLNNLIDEFSRRASAFTDRRHVSRQISKPFFQDLFHIFPRPDQPIDQALQALTLTAKPASAGFETNQK